jgi:cytochrome c553
MTRLGKALALMLLALLPACVYPTPTSILQGPPAGFTSPAIPPEYVGLRSPFTLDDPIALEAGRVLYLAHCTACHGENGRGYGPRAFQLEPLPADFAAPPMLNAFRNHQDYVFWWVTEGVPQTAMPAYELILSDVERWQVILYSWYLGELALPPVPAPQQRRYPFLEED